MRSKLHHQVGSTVKALLKLSGKRQADLAAALDVDPGSITKRFKGTTNITLDDVNAIAEFFDVPVTILFDAVEFQTWIVTNRPEWIIDLRTADATDTGGLTSTSDEIGWLRDMGQTAQFDDVTVVDLREHADTGTAALAALV